MSDKCELGAAPADPPARRASHEPVDNQVNDGNLGKIKKTIVQKVKAMVKDYVDYAKNTDL